MYDAYGSLEHIRERSSPHILLSKIGMTDKNFVSKNGIFKRKKIPRLDPLASIHRKCESLIKDYLDPKMNDLQKNKRKALKHQKVTKTTTKFCSNQCGKRTVNICSACDLYFCKTCFERKHQIF